MGIFWFILCFVITYHTLLSVLHPHHKLSYFKNAKWEDEWIEAARQLVRDEFDLLYSHHSMSQQSESSNRVCIACLYIFHLS